MPPSKIVKQSTRKVDKENSISFTQSVPKAVYKALCKYKKDKGFSTEQEVLRVWAIRCLEAAGYWPIKE